MEFPEIIYKYRDWSNPLHRYVLLYNELYFSSPKDFNDPFDCRITKNFQLLDTKKKRDEYIDKIMVDTFTQWTNSKINPDSMIKHMEQRLENLPALQKELKILRLSKMIFIME